MSARSTTLATRRAITAAAAMEERCRPYSRSMRARLSSTMWKVMRKKGSTSKNSCFTLCQSLAMVSPSSESIDDKKRILGHGSTRCRPWHSANKASGIGGPSCQSRPETSNRSGRTGRRANRLLEFCVEVRLLSQGAATRSSSPTSRGGCRNRVQHRSLWPSRSRTYIDARRTPTSPTQRLQQRLGRIPTKAIRGERGLGLEPTSTAPLAGADP